MNRHLEWMRAGLDWRVKASINNLMLTAAPVWRRRMLGRTTFIGVTGSAGKTTTKELLVGVLSNFYRGTGNPGTDNEKLGVVHTILQAGPRDDFCVMEFSVHEVGFIDWSLEQIRPRIGIVTVVRNDHIALYHSVEGIAREKSKLIRALPADGVAVLNADDPLVKDMARVCAGKVITYGSSPDADVRLMHATGAWPQRLVMTVRYGGREEVVQTQLCGTHWVAAVLGAIAGALAYGLTFRQIVQALAGIPPFTARMQPVTTASGATFIRDDWKAPLWTVDAALEFMEKAQAKRRIVVIGTISDYGGDASAQYARIAKRSQQVADITVFVGPWASRALRAGIPGREEALRVFSHVRAASAFVNSIARAGDLILLKGTAKQDHLSRIVHDSFGEVACWRDDCKVNLLCEECKFRMIPAGLAEVPVVTQPVPRRPAAGPIGARLIVCGLGNPGGEHDNTPHNVGMAAVDRMAEECGAEWTQSAGALIAQGRWREHDAVLIKLRAPMNESGRALQAVLEHLGADFRACVLVHDDLDLPLGCVRARMRSSAGGHRGVASILEAFQSDQLKRVKIGIGTGERAADPQKYVLTPLAGEHLDKLRAAMPEALARITSIARAQ